MLPAAVDLVDGGVGHNCSRETHFVWIWLLMHTSMTSCLHRGQIVNIILSFYCQFNQISVQELRDFQIIHRKMLQCLERTRLSWEFKKKKKSAISLFTFSVSSNSIAELVQRFYLSGNTSHSGVWHTHHASNKCWHGCGNITVYIQYNQCGNCK